MTTLHQAPVVEPRIPRARLTAVRPTRARPDALVLHALLRRSATGDTDAFMEFFDATAGCVLTLALARARLAGIPPKRRRAAAEKETADRYVLAWRTAADQPASGLSPFAWLLTLDPSGPDREAACA